MSNFDHNSISDEKLGVLLREHIKFFDSVNNIFEICPISACSAFLVNNLKECNDLPVVYNGVEYLVSVTKK